MATPEVCESYNLARGLPFAIRGMINKYVNSPIHSVETRFEAEFTAG